MSNLSNDTTWAFWSIEYELPKLNLVLTCVIDASKAATEEAAIKSFRERRPHGRIKKINGRPVKDNGVIVTEIDENDAEAD